MTEHAGEVKLSLPNEGGGVRRLFKKIMSKEDATEGSPMTKITALIEQPEIKTPDDYGVYKYT